MFTIFFKPLLTDIKFYLMIVFLNYCAIGIIYPQPIESETNYILYLSVIIFLGHQIAVNRLSLPVIKGLLLGLLYSFCFLVAYLLYVISNSEFVFAKTFSIYNFMLIRFIFIYFVINTLLIGIEWIFNKFIRKL